MAMRIVDHDDSPSQQLCNSMAHPSSLCQRLLASALVAILTLTWHPQVAECGKFTSFNALVGEIYGSGHDNELARYFDSLGEGSSTRRHAEATLEITNPDSASYAGVRATFERALVWLSNLDGRSCTSKLCGDPDTGCPPTRNKLGRKACKQECKRRQKWAATNNDTRSDASGRADYNCSRPTRICVPCWVPSDCPPPQYDVHGRFSCAPWPSCKPCKYGQWPPPPLDSDKYYRRSLAAEGAHSGRNSISTRQDHNKHKSSSKQKPFHDIEFYLSRATLASSKRHASFRDEFVSFVDSVRVDKNARLTRKLGKSLVLKSGEQPSEDPTLNLLTVVGFLAYRIHRLQCECKPCPVLTAMCKCPQIANRFQQVVNATERARFANLKLRLPSGNMVYTHDFLEAYYGTPSDCIRCEYPRHCPNLETCMQWPACPLCKRPVQNMDLMSDNPDLDLYQTNWAKGAYISPPSFAQPDRWAKRAAGCGRSPLWPETQFLPRSGAHNGSSRAIVGSSARISNAAWAFEGQFPSFVHVRQRREPVSHLEPLPYDYLCSGVLVSHRHVLTAAHCTSDDDVSTLFIMYNDTGIFKNDRHILVNVSRQEFVWPFNPRDKFCGDRGVLGDDFVLLTLDRRIEFTDYAQSACLPNEQVDLTDPYCIVVGSGKRVVTQKQKDYYLKWMDNPPNFRWMRVVPSDCNIYAISNADKTRQCWHTATLEGNPCPGDSGGPILCYASTKSNPTRRWILMGLTIWADCMGWTQTGLHFVATRIRGILPDLYRMGRD